MEVTKSCSLSYKAIEEEKAVKFKVSYQNVNNLEVTLVVTLENDVIMKIDNAVAISHRFNRNIMEVEGNIFNGLPTLYVGYYINSTYIIEVINSNMSLTFESIEKNLIRTKKDDIVIMRVFNSSSFNCVTVFSINSIQDKNIDTPIKSIVPLRMCVFNGKIYGLLKLNEDVGLYEITINNYFHIQLIASMDKETKDIVVFGKDDTIYYGAIIGENHFYYSIGKPDNFVVVHADIYKVMLVEDSVLLFLDYSIEEFVIVENYFKFLPFSFSGVETVVRLSRVFLIQIIIKIKDDETFKASITSISGNEEIVYCNKRINLIKDNEVHLLDGLGMKTINFFIPKKDYVVESMKVDIVSNTDKKVLKVDANDFICERFANLPKSKLCEIEILNENKEKLEIVGEFQRYLRELKKKNISSFAIAIDESNNYRFITGIALDKYIKENGIAYSSFFPFEDLKKLVRDIEKGFKKMKDWVIDTAHKVVTIIIEGAETVYHFLIDSLKVAVSSIMSVVTQIGVKIKDIIACIIDIFDYNDIQSTAKGLENTILKQLIIFRERIEYDLKKLNMEEIKSAIKDEKTVLERIDGLSLCDQPEYNHQHIDLAYKNNYVQSAVEEELRKMKISKFSDRIRQIVMEMMNKIPSEIKDDIAVKIVEGIARIFDSEIKEDNPLKLLTTIFSLFYKNIIKCGVEFIDVILKEIISMLVKLVDEFISEIQKPIPWISSILKFLTGSKSDITYLSLISLIISFPLTVSFKLINGQKKGGFFIEDHQSNGSYDYKMKYILHIICSLDQAFNFTVFYLENQNTLKWIAKFLYIALNAADLSRSNASILPYAAFGLSAISVVVSTENVGLICFLFVSNVLSCILSVIADNSWMNVLNNLFTVICDGVDMIILLGKLDANNIALTVKLICHGIGSVYSLVIGCVNVKNYIWVKNNTKYLNEIVYENQNGEVVDSLDEYINNFRSTLNLPVAVTLNVENDISPLGLTYDVDKITIPKISGKVYLIERISSIEFGYINDKTIRYIKVNNKHECGKKGVFMEYKMKQFQPKDKIIALCIFHNELGICGIGFIALNDN